jgi:hypothetical protein
MLPDFAADTLQSLQRYTLQIFLLAVDGKDNGFNPL